MTETARTDDRYACCEHCIDIKEGCPRLEGHSSPCPLEGCSSQTPMFGDDPVPAEMVETEIASEIAEWEMTQRVDRMREDLIDAIASIVGHEPPGVRVLLRALSHPSIVHEAKQYFEAMDINNRCTKYEPPWNCARQAEAQYQNISYGWLGAVSGIGYDETWCENCRKKVMGT